MAKFRYWNEDKATFINFYNGIYYENLEELQAGDIHWNPDFNWEKAERASNRKDSNKHIVYEGDLVVSTIIGRYLDRNLFVVVFSTKKNCFFLQQAHKSKGVYYTSTYDKQYKMTTCDLKIVGDIHRGKI